MSHYTLPQDGYPLPRYCTTLEVMQAIGHHHALKNGCTKDRYVAELVARLAVVPVGDVPLELFDLYIG